MQEMKAISSFLCMNVDEFRRLATDSNVLATDGVLDSLIRRSTIIELHDYNDDNDMSVASPSPKVDTSLKTKPQTNGSGTDTGGDDTYPLYRMGKAANAFTLILSGKVVVRAGAEGFESELGPWSYLGASAISGPAYVPDYHATAIRPFRVLQISRSDFMAANRANLVKKKSLAKHTRSSMRSSSGKSRLLDPTASFQARAMDAGGQKERGAESAGSDNGAVNGGRARDASSSRAYDMSALARGYSSTGSIEIRIDDSDDDQQARMSRHNSDGNDRLGVDDAAQLQLPDHSQSDDG